MAKKQTLDPATIRTKLIVAGVKNLREFGYPSCDENNILTDYIYGNFFKSMLNDNLGAAGPSVDKVIKVLLEEVNRVIK